MSIAPLTARPCLPSVLSPYVTLEEIKSTRPEWYPLARIAFNSVGRIVDKRGMHLGCGVLVGVDRLLLPPHILEGLCLPDIEVWFEIGTLGSFCSRALQVLACNREKDFCLLHLSAIKVSTTRSFLPGELCPVPSISYETPLARTLLVHIDVSENKVLSFADPCRTPSLYARDFCSYHPTVPGSSGGAYFTAAGLTAIHRARSTGLCDRSADERSAIPLIEIARSCSLLSLPPCTRICPPDVIKGCFAKLPTEIVPCYKEERGRPVISGTFLLATRAVCRYWETRPTNASGPGPRGLRVTISPREGAPAVADIRLRINENPHDFPEYNRERNQPAFYETAARAVCDAYLTGRDFVPPPFIAFGVRFTLRHV